VSQFIGRFDNNGQNGVDLVANIKRMYRKGDEHVLVLEPRHGTAAPSLSRDG